MLSESSLSRIGGGAAGVSWSENKSRHVLDTIKIYKVKYTVSMHLNKFTACAGGGTCSGGRGGGYLIISN